MKTNHLERTSYWKTHVEAATRGSESSASYCKANGLSSSSFYKWKSRLNRSETFANKSPSKPERFLPIVISDKHTVSSGNLPDAKWVVEVLTGILRACL